MPYDPDRHHRRSIRLQGYDYSQAGAYFVTICTHGRVCWLSTLVDGEVELSTVGCIVDEEWAALPARFPQVDLDAFVIMPNHVHAIIVITDTLPSLETFPNSVGTGLAPSNNHRPHMPEKPDAPNEPSVRGVPTLGNIVGAFKSLAARRSNRVLDRTGRFGNMRSMITSSAMTPISHACGNTSPRIRAAGRKMTTILRISAPTRRDGACPVLFEGDTVRAKGRPKGHPYANT